LTISGNEISNTTNQGLQLAGTCGDVAIENNSISNTNTSQGADKGAIRLYGADFTGMITITGNILTSSHNGVAVKDGQDITGKDITITNNSITNFSGGDAIYNGGTGTLSATCNWYGTSDAQTISDGIQGDVNYEPYLSAGGDSGNSSPGFDPLAACNGCSVGGGLVTNMNTGNTYCTIQDAIDAATSGDMIHASDGTYDERVVIDKSLTLEGDSEAGTIIDGETFGSNGRGIFIQSGVENVIIQDLTVEDFAGTNGNIHAGLYAIGGNNNLTVQRVTLQNNVGGSGFYANGPIDNVLIDDVTASGHTNSARGIVIWNGLKTNITISNCEVFNNNCCGIELSDGDASAVTFTNNNIHDNGDNGIGIVGLNGSVGQNYVTDNTLENNGRFGIEIKNPGGAVEVSGNNVSRTQAISDQRDIVGIAVFRRGVLNDNVDVPNGVTVTSNTVSGYQQTSDSDGFGILIEGTNHTVTGNTVENNDVGIQQQAGHQPYPGNGDQSNLDDEFFGRGNSPETCGNTISGNTYIGNGTDTRNINVGGGLVTNTNTGNTYCTIQDAIDDPATLAGHTITVAAGTFNEDLLINKSVTLQGAGIDNSIIDHSGNPGNGNAGVYITANDVTMKGFTVIDNDGGSVPRYGLKVGTSGVTTDDVTLEDVKVTQSYRTGFDLARPKDLSLIGVEAIDNGGAGIFMTNAEGVDLTNVTTSGNPWIGISVATRDDWAGDTYEVVFSGTNSIGEVGTDNGGLQIEPVVGMPISWSDGSVSADVTIQPTDFEYALSGPTTNSFTSGGNTIVYDPYTRFYKTLGQAVSAADGAPSHVEPYDRYIQDAISSAGDPATEFYVYDNTDDKMSIQAAVDASVDGNKINVYDGDFTEQVEVAKDITIEGQGAGVTHVIGFDNMPLFFTTTNDNYPIIYVHDAVVNISGLTVDGDGKGGTNYRFQGIGFENAGGSIDGIEVKAIRENPLNGTQHGNGIFANADNGTPRNLEILNSDVFDCQKNAIALNGADLTVLVEGNTVTGAGPTGLIGQNGIQVGFGATGEIRNNEVSEFYYTGSGFIAAGIILFNADGSVQVGENSVVNCQGGIASSGAHGNIERNEINGGEYAVLFYNTTGDVSILNNAISDATYSLYIAAAAAGSDISVNDNSFTDYSYAIVNGSSVQIDASCNWYGTSDATLVDASVSGDLTYNPYLVDGTDASGAIGFQPTAGSCSGDSEGCTEPNADNYDPNAIFNDGSCEYCFEELDFSSTVAVDENENPDAWYTDRYAPASFESVVFDNDDRLLHSIDATDGDDNRTGFDGAFYNTQGRKYDLTTGATKEIGIELYVPSAWENSSRRMAGIWGTGFDNADAVSAYPIIEFTSDGTPRFRGYEGDGSWIDIGLPNNFSYDTWVTLTIKLLPSGEFRYEVGDLSVTTQLHGSNGTTYLGNVILQGHNTTAGVTYDIHWDNFYNSYGTELEYDAVLSSPILIGSGLSNDHMAVADLCDIEAGIKAHKRYLGDVIPVTGDVPGDTYQFGTGVSPMSSANVNPDPGTARWNYLVSVDLGDQTFNDLNVYLDIDFDPSDGSGQTGPYVADLSQFMIDNGSGSASLYQDSQNLGFNFWQAIGSSEILPFDPYAEGVYDLTVRVETPAGVELLNAPIRVEVACEYVEASEDLEAPFVDCPDDLVIDTDPGACNAVVSGAEPTITADDCDINLTYTVTGATTDSGSGDVNGLVFNTGESTVTYNATDGNGNVSSPCSFTVTVEDNEAPVVTCVDQTVTLDNSGSGSVTLGDVLGTSTDNCGITDVELSQNTFDCSDIGAGADNVTITVTDNAGNQGTCTATITVEDTQDPQIDVCPGNQSISTDSPDCTASLPDYSGFAETSDNCTVTITQSPAANTLLSVGPHTVTITATDSGNNTDECSFIVTVTETVTGSSTSVTACDNYDWNGTEYSSTGQYYYTTQPVGSCTNIDTLNLTINESTASSIVETACDSYTTPDGAVYTSTGVYTAVIPNEAGCDSTITIDLTVITPGDSCDDGDPLTENDVYDANCDCAGTPVVGTVDGTVDWNQDCGNRNGTIKFYQPGTAILVEQYNITVDQNGDFSTPASGVTPGNYDVFVKVEGYLQKGFDNVSIGSGSNNLVVGSIIGGDLNGDNAVTAADGTVASDAFLSTTADPNFNPIADYNCDGAITAADVTVISASFLMTGDEPNDN
jgi:hypothetical protein